MSSGYAGANSYGYWGVEGTEGAGDPSSDQNIPFNPQADQSPQKPKYVDTVEYVYSSLVPHTIYTGELAPGEGPFNGSFRDPFLLLTFFTNKTVGGVWGIGTGTITADMTATTDRDTIFYQYRIADQSASANHIDKLLKHGLPMKYSWKVEPAKLLAEIAEFKFLDFATNTRAPVIANTFHDQAFGSAVGGWAAWDNTGLNGTGKRSVTEMVLHWGAAVLTGLNIQTMEMSFEVGQDTVQLYNSRGQSTPYYTVRNFQLSLTGLVADLTLIAEYEKIFSDRTKADLILYYDKTLNYEKYLKFTQAYISPESDIVSIPESGKPAEVTLVIKGGEGTTPSFSGKYKDLVDPSVMITAA